jgi:hypothetical protein
MKKRRAHYYEHRIARATTIADSMPYSQLESDFDLKGFDWEGQVL